MEPRVLIHRLLFVSLTELRAEDAITKDRWFHLTSLFYQTPLMLEQLAKGEYSYDEILARIRLHARQQGLIDWLEHVISESLEYHAGRSDAVIHRLLYLMLIDVRQKANATGNAKAFCLADLFHSVPLRLHLALSGQRSYQEILEWIRQRAHLMDCEELLLQINQAVLQLAPNEGQDLLP